MALDAWLSRHDPNSFCILCPTLDLRTVKFSMLIVREQQNTDRTQPARGIQVPKYYFFGLYFSLKQPLALCHRP